MRNEISGCKSLSKKEDEKLEKIWEEYTGYNKIV